MGLRIRKETGNSLPISVIISLSEDEPNLYYEATKWCKSSAIKHNFYVSPCRTNETENTEIIHKNRIFNILDLSGIYPTIFTSINSFTKVYASFKFQDRRDAALFKMYWC